jgi:hypothetical protein
MSRKIVVKIFGNVIELPRSIKIKKENLSEHEKYLSKVSVIFTDEKISGYVGMNWWAAKERKIDFPYNKDVMLIWRNMTKEERLATIEHEIREMAKMSCGAKYYKAHAMTLVEMGDLRHLEKETASARQQIRKLGLKIVNKGNEREGNNLNKQS